MRSCKSQLWRTPSFPESVSLTDWHRRWRKGPNPMFDGMLWLSQRLP